MRVAPPWKERKKECKCSVQSAGSSASKKVLAHRAGSPALEEEELQKRKCADFPAQEEQLDDWKNSKRKKKGKTESKERCAGTSAAPKRKIWFDDVAPVEDVEVGAGSSAASSGDSAGSSATPQKVDEEAPVGKNGSAGSSAPMEEEVCGEDEECEVPKSVKIPEEVSRQDREEHELLGHVQYRSWCRHCVASRGIGQSHRRCKEIEKDSIIPEVVFDYYFMGEENATAPPRCAQR